MKEERSPEGATASYVVPAGDARAKFEMAVVLLRGEWRAGFPAGIGYRTVLGNARRLRGIAASEQLAADLSALIADLEAYEGMTVPQRQAALPGIAAAIKRLIPRVAALDIAARPLGALEAAERPKRATPRQRPEPPPTPRVALPPPDVPAANAPASRATRPAQRASVPAPRLALADPVTALKGAGGATSKKLAKLGVETVGDLLLLSPRRHIDYSRTIRIGEALNLHPGSDVTVRGRVTDVQLHRGPGKPRVTVKLADASGWVRVTWFNQYLANVLHVGDEIAVSGALESGYGPLSFTGPEWEKVAPGPGGGVSTGRIVPVYPLTAGLAQKSMRNFTRQALELALGAVEEYLPEAVRAAAGAPLLPLQDAVAQVHYPDDAASLEAAKTRLAFDDLFLLQLGLVRRKTERQAFDGVPIAADRDLLARWSESLPFRLTNAQQSALEEIVADLGKSKPMARLLQGDVGSGKTAVAAAAMLATVANGHQAAMMAPTEILAEQHLQNLVGLYGGLPETERPRVQLLTGSTRARERKAILEGARSGEIDILVGTHALIQETIELPRLALSIVDEQHRFGVRQRASLPGKAEGKLPHQLAMTATPIPRTLNLVLHGDLDVSILAERPPGRVPIETRRYVGAERTAAYALVWEEVAKGRQVFVICPLVEASEAIEAKAAIEEAERLREEVFPDLRIATLHGRMKARDKDAIMTGFRDRDYDLLVSTSVIEVGIDVPNATVMLIEGADRFGLAQLHQFRGRVGRGGNRSFCLLLAEEASPDGEERLQAMVASDDGFLLAEKDLELRGPGDFIGTRQSGLPEMQWLEGVFDTRLLDRARRAAERLLAEDPELTRPEHLRLAERFERFWERAAPEKAV
ncbi:MAG: ATP-dependent DNA helicase RecG [Thermomicrobiales bacterium]|nr:ATP-dependent DNA helicase RecG [Thermomicrobiales bacterium]